MCREAKGWKDKDNICIEKCLIPCDIDILIQVYMIILWCHSAIHITEENNLRGIKMTF